MRLVRLLYSSLSSSSMVKSPPTSKVGEFARRTPRRACNGRGAPRDEAGGSEDGLPEPAMALDLGVMRKLKFVLVAGIPLVVGFAVAVSDVKACSCA